MRRIKFLFAFCCAFAVYAAGAVEITGVIPVNVTADTAAAAKARAFNSAQRDVIATELRPYANVEQLNAAIKRSSDDELSDIISSSAVTGERVSDTTYTANISFVIDGDAAKSWMEKYSVENSLPSSNAAAVVAPENYVVAVATLYNPIYDWAALNAAARAVDIDIATKNIIGSRVSFVVPDVDASKLTRTLRENGWRVSNSAGGIVISR